MKLADNLYFYPEKGMLDCNTYVITGDPTIIIDPGAIQPLSELIQDLNKDGIKPENIERIFEIFHRADADGSGHGYGIGLALVKKTLETANCTIEAKSGENKITVFRFTLPCAISS